MKKVYKAATVIAVAVLLFTVVLGAANNSYSTASDPLVSMSYINNVLKAQLKKELLTNLTDSLKEELSAAIIAEINGGEVKSGASSSGYEVVNLKNGQKLMAKDACEIILRSGSASAVVTGQENINQGIGLNDITAGGDVLNGVSLPSKHLILIPRGDGRGVVVTSEEAYFMVRGEHEIVAG